MTHPDHRWLEQVATACQAWQERPAIQPTSSVFATGAVESAERLMSEMHGGRPAILVPSGTFGLYMALRILNVGQGDEVLVPAVDWPSTCAAVRAVGATPVPVDVVPCTLTIDPEAAARCRTGRTVAAVACHLHGYAADIPAMRHALKALPIIEDCAQALGSQIDGQLVGTLGDIAVFSFGPGKTIDAGEGGAVICAPTHYRRALSVSAHPLRLLLRGEEPGEVEQLTMRVHPLAAVLIWHGLTSIEHRLAALWGAHSDLERSLRAADPRRKVAAVPVIVPRRRAGLQGLASVPSDAACFSMQGREARDSVRLVMPERTTPPVSVTPFVSVPVGHRCCLTASASPGTEGSEHASDSEDAP